MGATLLVQLCVVVRSSPLAWRRDLQQLQQKAPADVIITCSSETARMKLGAATSTACAAGAAWHGSRTAVGPWATDRGRSPCVFAKQCSMVDVSGVQA